jgi:hypothetical protein
MGIDHKNFYEFCLEHFLEVHNNQFGNGAKFLVIRNNFTQVESLKKKVTLKK